MSNFYVADAPMISLREAREILEDQTISKVLRNFFAEHTSTIYIDAIPKVTLRGSSYYQHLVSLDTKSLETEIHLLKQLTFPLSSNPAISGLTPHLETIALCLWDHLYCYTYWLQNIYKVQRDIQPHMDIYEKYASYASIKDYYTIASLVGNSSDLQF